VVEKMVEEVGVEEMENGGGGWPKEGQGATIR